MGILSSWPTGTSLFFCMREKKGNCYGQNIDVMKLRDETVLKILLILVKNQSNYDYVSSNMI